jgi:hypothetical protein
MATGKQVYRKRRRERSRGKYLARWETTKGRMITAHEREFDDLHEAVQFTSKSVVKVRNARSGVIFGPEGGIVYEVWQGGLQRGPFFYEPNVADDPIIGSVGDVNPIEYGGGVVFDTEHGPVLEYTRGLEDEEVDEDDEGATELSLYRVDIEEDALEHLNWVKPGDLKSIAQTMDRSVKELRKAAKSEDVMQRVSFYEDVAGYYGWENLDSYPFKITARELEQRWEQ